MVVLCSAFFRSVVHKGVFLGHYLTIPLIIQLLNNLIVSNLTYFLLQPIVSFVSSFQFPSKSNLLKILYIFTVHRIEFYLEVLLHPFLGLLLIFTFHTTSPPAVRDFLLQSAGNQSLYLFYPSKYSTL